MMKNFTLSLFACLCSFTAWGAYGIFQGGVTVGGTTYFDNSVPPSPSTFNGQAFSVVQGGTLNLTFAFVKTFKNGGSDVCGAKMHYAVYPTAGAPSFTAITLCFFANLGGGGDQEWNSTNCPFGPINLASGLMPGNYKIAVFYSAPGGNCGTPANVFQNNGGANYVADLTITVPLAINLTAFDAQRSEAGVQLTWQATAERDHAAYDVERRATNGQWLPLGTVKTSGPTTTITDYAFTDVRPLTGDNYYRLAMRDIQGKITFSHVVLVKAQYASPWQVSPNPASDALTLRFVEQEAPEAALIQLYNAQGALVLAQRAVDGDAVIRVPLTGLASGVYRLEIQSGDGVRVTSQTVIKN